MQDDLKKTIDELLPPMILSKRSTKSASMAMLVGAMAAGGSPGIPVVEAKKPCKVCKEPSYDGFCSAECVKAYHGTKAEREAIRARKNTQKGA